MKNAILTLLLFFSVFMGWSQGNCLMHPEGSNERKACEYGYKAIEFKQGSRESQMLFDSAIVLNPNYAWAYFEKSVAYLKRGLLHEGILLLNNAVELEPLEYLPYRAYWYYNHDSFEPCKNDLERYYSMDGNYQQYTPGGGLDMRIMLGLTHYKMGETEKGIAAVETAIDAYGSEDYVGPYDYEILGALYFFNEEYDKAKETLLKSVSWNPGFAHTHYYLAMTYKALGETTEAMAQLETAKAKFDGKDGGYSRYSFCFRASKEMVEEELEVLKEG